MGVLLVARGDPASGTGLSGGSPPTWAGGSGFLPYRHLHHVATGYESDLLGEAGIGAFELRGGGATPLVRLLCVGAIAMALLVAPRRVIRAWRRARGARTLYALRPPYEQLLESRVGELRAMCRLGEERRRGTA